MDTRVGSADIVSVAGRWRDEVGGLVEAAG